MAVLKTTDARCRCVEMAVCKQYKSNPILTSSCVVCMPCLVCILPPLHLLSVVFGIAIPYTLYMFGICSSITYLCTNLLYNGTLKEVIILASYFLASFSGHSHKLETGRRNHCMYGSCTNPLQLLLSMTLSKWNTFPNSSEQKLGAPDTAPHLEAIFVT